MLICMFTKEQNPAATLKRNSTESQDTQQPHHGHALNLNLAA